MVKSRKCLICPIHNKKHYDPKEKKRCEYEKALVRKKELEIDVKVFSGENIIHNEEIDEGHEIMDKDKNEEKNSKELAFDDLQFGSNEESDRDREPENNKEENYQAALTVEEKTFECSEKHYRVYGPKKMNRIEKIMEDKRLELIKIYGDRGNYFFKDLIANEVLRFKTSIENAMVELEEEKKRLKLLIDERTKKKEKGKDFWRNVIHNQELKIRRIELYIDPHCYMDYVELPKLDTYEKLCEFFENLEDWKIELYDPFHFEDLVQFYIRKIKIHEKYNEKSDFMVKYREFEDKIKKTRNTVFYNVQISNASVNLYREIKDDREEKRNYNKTGFYKKEAITKRKDYSEKYSDSWEIAKGWMESIKRNEKRGQYHYKLLSGQAVTHGLQATDDNEIRRVRFNLINNPWSRLCFTGDAIRHIFGRNKKTKTILKRREGRSHRNFHDQPDNETRMFIENSKEKVNIVLVGECEKNRFFPLDFYKESADLEDECRYWDFQKKRQENKEDLLVNLYSPSEHPTFEPLKEGEKRVYNPYEYHLIPEWNSTEEESSEIEQNIDITEQTDDKNVKAMSDEIESETENEEESVEIEVQPPRKEENKIFRKDDLITIEKHAYYMDEKEKSEFLKRCIFSRNPLRIIEKREKSYYYFKHMYRQFQICSKKGEIDRWKDFMKKYHFNQEICEIQKESLERKEEKELTEDETIKKLVVLIYNNEGPSEKMVQNWNEICEKHNFSRIYNHTMISKVFSHRMIEESENIRESLNNIEKIVEKSHVSTMDCEDCHDFGNNAMEEENKIINKREEAKDMLKMNNEFWKNKKETWKNKPKSTSLRPERVVTYRSALWRPRII